MILSILNFWNLLKTIVQSKLIDFSTFLSLNFYNSCESKFYEKFHWKMAKVDSIHREDSIHKESLYVEILCWSIAFSLTKLLFLEKSFIHVYRSRLNFTDDTIILCQWLHIDFVWCYTFFHTLIANFGSSGILPSFFFFIN